MERKLATVMFVDIVGSTELVSTGDPEVVRRRVQRFFDQVAQCIKTHGGIVEKFAGDAVMAAFGIPTAHEDDAERAARAALAIVQSVGELGLEVRIGIEAGEIVTEAGDSSFATGGPVNLAARLQAEAAPCEVLIGPTARRLTLGRVVTEPLGPRTLRGFSHPVEIWRVVRAEELTGRRLSVAGPFVGREAELELLQNTWERALRDERAHLFTIYGEPGLGKSRLAREFVAAVEGVTVLVGRCLPYGESITYWPLAEMVKAAAGISDDDPAEEAMEKLRACCGEEAVADLLALASGVLEAVSGDRSAQEIAWAAQGWATELADAQPLILGFEDIHWAEEPLLELVEHLADRVRAPLLILCLARPELLEVRPSWGGGRVRATAIELEPLPARESEQLIDALLDQQDLQPADRQALIEKTEGNPLFVEETVRMLAEVDGDRADGRIPDTVQALIAARIDRLAPDVKAALQRGAVVGRVFWGGAVAALSPDGDVEPALDELLAREMVTLEPRSTISGEQAFRFKHVLIREVAYSGLSKEMRAELHRGFADWLLKRGADELIEVRAHHLDRAAALIAELEGSTPSDLAAEAAASLTAAGKRALAREANRSGRKLLLRALELEPTLERRYQAARAAWRLTDLPAVSAEMETVRSEAAAIGDTRLEGRALTALAEVALSRSADVPRARELADRALAILPPDDDIGRYETLGILSRIGWWEGDLGSVERYTRQTLEIAGRLGRKDLESGAIIELADVRFERLDAEGGEELLEHARELAEESDSFVARAWIASRTGKFRLLRNELDAAAAAFDQAHRLFVDAGVTATAARILNWSATVQWRKGDLRRAEQLFREAIGMLKPLGDRGTLVESQRRLAQVLLEQGKVQEAERYALDSRETVGARDMGSRASTRVALALVRAAQSRDGEAETLFREALDILAETDYRSHEIEPLHAFAEFLRARGRDDEAVAYEERAARLAPESAARIA